MPFRYAPMPWLRRGANFDPDLPIWLLGKFYHARTWVAEDTPGVADSEIITEVVNVFSADLSSVEEF